MSEPSFSFQLTHTDGGARRGVMTTPHGDGRHAGVHAGRHAGRGERASRTAISKSIGAADSAEQHLSPVSAPRRRSDRAARRTAPLHRLEQADPDRQRRLPGVQPGRAAHDRRGRRALPVASRRLVASADAGEGGRHPGAARIGHRDGARRVPRASRDARDARARRWQRTLAGPRARATRLLRAARRRRSPA